MRPIREYISYLSIFGFLLLSQSSVLPHSTESKAKSKVKLSKHTKLVVFSYDGFRFDYMSKVNTPNLKALRANGVTTDYQIPQFPSITFVNHQSLVTGVNPEIHGVTGRTLWDPMYGRELSGSERQEEFWKFKSGVYPLWIWNEWAGDGRKSGVQWPGSRYACGKNRTTATYTLSYNASRPYEARMDYVISWLTNPKDPANLIFMYFDEPDKQGHAFGPNSAQVRDAIKRMDDVTGYFIHKLKKLNILDDVNLIFWSDHGMEEIKLSTNVINFKTMVDTKLYDVHGGSPVLHIWPKQASNTNSIFKKFVEGSKTKNFTAYKKADLPERWRLKNNRRVGPIVLVADPGYLFNEKSRKAKQGGVIGYHGFDNWNPNMRPYFIAHGPNFKKGVKIPPFHNVDLFPLICKLMGFGAPKNNGTLRHVEAALL